MVSKGQTAGLCLGCVDFRQVIASLQITKNVIPFKKGICPLKWGTPEAADLQTPKEGVTKGGPL